MHQFTIYEFLDWIRIKDLSSERKLAFIKHLLIVDSDTLSATQQYERRIMLAVFAGSKLCQRGRRRGEMNAAKAKKEKLVQ